MADATLVIPAKRRRWPLLAVMLRDPKIVFGGGFILVLIVLALGADWIAPHDPLMQDLMLGSLPPAGMAGTEPGYWLGTDDLGRDVLSRFIHGTRTALTVAFIAATIAAVLGTVVGLLAGFFGGWVDAVVSRLIEIWMAFPAVLLSILIVAILGTGVHSVIFAIAIIDWTRFARVVRAETMAQKQADYVTAGQVLGFSRFGILIGEILPNVLWVVLGLFTLELGLAVVIEAILSFVGLSVSSDTPTWGGMIAQGRGIIYQAWWVFALPLAGLLATVLAFNQLGVGLRRSLDPVMQR
ncbi:ABC transporter permease [Devosia rhizoryzae]|uniref:ABC transporter permease n=1 Tax=Devosia rhizoryzae TaxID=2774137 RepID=A0ABX7C916_9HYPH|nr:ABC transporter permease [Devosia rhizoryzae]QQR40759.1 ABC transporter permease [Devosia rhizoryzae]